MKSIIVEGYDNMGKSTLIDDLHHTSSFNFPIHRAGPPAQNDAHAILCCEEQLDKMVHQSSYTLFDRITPISRTCYQFDIGDRHRRTLSMFLREMMRHSIIVWCDTDNDPESHVVKEYDTPEHLEFLHNNEFKIISNYRDIMASLPGVIRYDYRAHSIDQLVEKIDVAVSSRL